MRTSEQLDQLGAALVAFQAEMPAVPKNHTVDTGKYEYQYADLADIMDAAKSRLAKTGLSVSQGVGFVLRETDGATVHTITTLVLHSSGQWIESEMVIPHLGDIRALGSSITYGRRYAYCASLGIVADDDDDGTLAVTAFGEDAARRRQQGPPASSTSTSGGRAPAPTEGNGNGTGEKSPAKMSAKDRNAMVRHFAQLEPPIRGDAVLGRVQNLLNDKKIKALTDVTGEQGRKLFELLDIASVARGGPRPDLNPAGEEA